MVSERHSETSSNKQAYCVQPKDQEDLTDSKITSINYKYGWFAFTPSWIQLFHTAGWLLVFLSLGNWVENAVVSGLLGVVLSTIERRFELSSSQSSWIASACDLGTIPVLLAFCFIGSK